MAVLGNLCRDERDVLRAGRLSLGVILKARALAKPERAAAAKVRKGEGGGSVAAVGGSQQRKQRLVLINRQELAIA